MRYMTRNPLWNALAATTYIVAIAHLMFFTQGLDNTVEAEILAPITVLSLLVFSVATMAYLFFYGPLTLYLDGHKKAALDYFIKTLVIFGGITFALLFVILSLHMRL
jgi:hypothetical protein